MPFKVWIALAIELVIFGALLFGVAGTVNWLASWVFLALFALSVIPMGIGLAKHDPGLLEERAKSPIQANQPLWDRVWMTIFLFLTVVLFVVPALDFRFGWSLMPFWLQATGGIIMMVSLYLAYVAMRYNSYLAPVVKVQEERGHKVISTGPYAIVRHPFYAAIAPFFPAVGVLLGSWWAVILSLLVIPFLAYRAVREERHLEQELDGYAEYLKKVHYRLVPYVW